MSAFILSDFHISKIVDYIHAMNEYINPQELANKLKSINIKSVNYRYNEKTRITKCKLKHNQNVALNNADIIRLIQCWIYQSCEKQIDTDFQVYKMFLLSFFNDNQIDNAHHNSDKWSI